MSKLCIIITTTNDLDIANLLVAILLNNKLAACIQIEQGESYFIWEGKVTNEKEFRLNIKTLDSKYNEVEKVILSNHNYKLPEIIKIDVADSTKDYRNWIEKNIG